MINLSEVHISVLPRQWRPPEGLPLKLMIVLPAPFLKELQDHLAENGVEVTKDQITRDAGLQSAAGWISEVLVAAVGSGGAITALAISLQKLIERHKDKRFTLISESMRIDVTGYSIKELERILMTVECVRRRIGEDEQHSRPTEQQRPPKGQELHP